MMAHTYSTTKTYTRIIFLKMQLRRALRTTTDISEAKLNTLMKAVENQWVKSIDVYAFNRSNLCRAQLQLDIDWNEHNRLISIGKVNVAVDVKWNNNILIEVDEAIWAFNEFVNTYNLNTKWRVGYTKKVWDSASLLREVRAYLGTSPGAKIKWHSKKVSDSMRNKDFPDLKLGLHFTE